MPLLVVLPGSIVTEPIQGLPRRAQEWTFGSRDDDQSVLGSDWGGEPQGATMTERDELFMRNTDAFSWYLEADPGLRATILAIVWLDERPDFDVLEARDRKSTSLNSSHLGIPYAAFCLKKKTRRGAHTPSPHPHSTRLRSLLVDDHE